MTPAKPGVPFAGVKRGQELTCGDLILAKLAAVLLRQKESGAANTDGRRRGDQIRYGHTLGGQHGTDDREERGVATGTDNDAAQQI